jgi:hypothetical protein
MSIEMSLGEMMESSGRNSKTFTLHVPSHFLPSELFKIITIEPEGPAQMDFQFHPPSDFSFVLKMSDSLVLYRKYPMS